MATVADIKDGDRVIVRSSGQGLIIRDDTAPVRVVHLFEPEGPPVYAVLNYDRMAQLGGGQKGPMVRLDSPAELIDGVWHVTG